MVAGHLREKKGYFYAVLNYTDAHGNRKTKWIATGLAVKGNKKRAEAFLQEQRRSFQEDVPITGDVLFADFMEQWLTVIKSSVAVTTFASYSNMVKKVIVPYFRERQIAGAVGKTHPGFLPEGTGTCERVLGYSLSRKHPQGVEVCCQARPNLQ